MVPLSIRHLRLPAEGASFLNFHPNHSRTFLTQTEDVALLIVFVRDAVPLAFSSGRSSNPRGDTETLWVQGRCVGHAHTLGARAAVKSHRAAAPATGDPRGAFHAAIIAAAAPIANNASLGLFFEIEMQHQTRIGCQRRR